MGPCRPVASLSESSGSADGKTGQTLELRWRWTDPLVHQLISVLLTIDFTVREDGPNLIQNLILWPFGINLFLLALATVGLHTFERYAASRYLKRHPREADPLAAPLQEEEDDEEASAQAENCAHHLGNAILIALAAALLAMNMLAVPRQGTLPSDRSDWFWFWIMPMPSESGRVYHKLLNQYAPLK